MDLFTRRAARVAVGVGVVALAHGVASASVVTSNVADDSAFNALGLAPVFEAQGRIGNAQTNGTQEADIGETTASPVDQAQFAWGSNQPIDFTLSYDVLSNLVTFSIFGQELTYVAGDDPTELAIRMRATTQRAGISVALEAMDLDGHAIPDVAAANPGDGVEYLRIQGAEILDGFTLSGRARMVFDGANPPTNSNLAFQIKGVVPAPGAAGVLALSALACVRRRR